MTDNLLTAEIPAETEQGVEPQASGKPEQVPAKFWDNDKQEIRVDILLNSYLALEKKLSTMVAKPESEDDKVRLLKLCGLPDTPDQYDINLDSDVIGLDPELNARLHAKGFTNEQVQEIYDLANERLVPLILEMAAEFQADRELERLVSEFGGAEKWGLVSKQLQDFGAKNLPPAAYQGLCCSYEGVMALYQMMKLGSKNPMLKSAADKLGVFDEASLAEMMKSPKYWKDRDPAFIAKVSEGFSRLYEGK